MKVQTRLTLFSSILFALLLLLISLTVFTLYARFIKKSLNKQLEKSSFVTALFYLEEDELNKIEFAEVRQQFHQAVTNVYYQVYDEENLVRYGSTRDSVTTQMLNHIRKEESYSFSDSHYFCHGIFYRDNEGDFVIVAKEPKETLYSQLKILGMILLFSFIGGNLLYILLSRKIAYIAYTPFRKVIKEVNQLSTKGQHLTIASPHTRDELDELIQTFNQLLKQIDETFIIQRNFVKYISHEFKTPLASIAGNLEVFSIKKRSPQEYQEIANQLIEDVHNLTYILNTLLVISDLKTPLISSENQTRIDELIWEIIDKIKLTYTEAQIEVDLCIKPEDENLLSIRADRTQLYMSLFNLIENGVKYSPDKRVKIRIDKTEGQLSISIEDEGIGISPQQLPYISKPFYRADNSDSSQGSGIGLSIALRILDKNRIHYTIESQPNKGTSIKLFFKA